MTVFKAMEKTDDCKEMKKKRLQHCKTQLKRKLRKNKFMPVIMFIKFINFTKDN